MTVREQAAAIVGREGGWVDHPDDRGGPTKHGITLPRLQIYRGAQCSVEDLKNLSADEAIKILVSGYYIEQFNTVPEWLAGQLFDIAVNMGKHKAVVLLQKAVNTLGPFDIEVDGKWGPLTAAAVDKTVAAWSKTFGDALVDERMFHYAHLVKSDPSQVVFLEGWLRRAASFRSWK